MSCWAPATPEPDQLLCGGGPHATSSYTRELGGDEEYLVQVESSLKSSSNTEGICKVKLQIQTHDTISAPVKKQ